MTSLNPILFVKNFLLIKERKGGKTAKRKEQRVKEETGRSK